MERDRRRLAGRQRAQVRGERGADEAEAVLDQVPRRQRQQDDEEQAGDEGGAQVHERQRLATRVEGKPAARALCILSISPPAAKDAPLGAGPVVYGFVPESGAPLPGEKFPSAATLPRISVGGFALSVMTKVIVDEGGGLGSEGATPK